ncbi:ABC transporter ATP-binding protein/permease [bacterium]|nr:ABC transporter ATP-binding protein/permease [bacterium]
MFAFFERLIDPFPPQEPEQPPSGLYAFCRHYTKGIEPILVLMALVIGLIAIIEVSLFAFLGAVVDWLSSANPETFLIENRERLWWWAFVVMILLPAAISFRSLLTFQTLFENYPMSVRWKSYRHLFGQSLSFYQNEFAGRVATKVMQASQAVRETIMQVLQLGIYATISFLGVIVVLMGFDGRLLLPLFIWLLLYIGILYFFIPRLKQRAEKQSNARSDMTGRITDTFSNILTVKLFSHAKRENLYIKNSMQHFLTVVHGQFRLVTGFTVSVCIINSLLILSTIWLSIYLWSLDLISIGAIAAAVGLVIKLYGMSQWVMWETSRLFENIGIVQDGISTISIPYTLNDTPKATSLVVNKGEIFFNRVRFNYEGSDTLFDDLSLKIKAGEKVGLVGRSGAGKSTFVNLLLRFFDVKHGSIFIDGQDITGVTQESLRENIGVVTQDTSLLHRSIRDNILYGKPSASVDEMLNVATQAKVHEFVDSLTDHLGRSGYDAYVGERGVKLSGGQRQRIAIARVLLKDAPILILDEATSALDSETELAIQENLHSLMQGKTVVAIAHRLSTIAEMDRLIVMDKGRIVEEGTHACLISRGGLYAQLWAHQSGDFLVEDTV